MYENGKKIFFNVGPRPKAWQLSIMQPRQYKPLQFLFLDVRSKARDLNNLNIFQ